jgi:glycosyltransferase involved in cell wall biosynthesis
VSQATVEPMVAGRTGTLAVSGVVDSRSIGVARYARLLAGVLAGEGVAYRLVERRDPTRPAHVHLANSSRSLLRQPRRPQAAFAVTVHDVVPRTRALLPAYRALAYPQVTRRAAAAVVHTAWAADMLVRAAGRPRRLEVIPHPVPPRHVREDRLTARQALGWPDDRLIAVVPGVIRGVKLVAEALAAGDGSPGWQIALAGRLADPGLAREAHARGALILAEPDDLAYERAVVAADCVLCLRAGSVGETNGPLLDALGAGRAVIATRTGSIPEVAGNAVHYCDATVASLQASLAALTDAETRVEFASMAAARGATLTWEASAAAHAELFREVLDA